MNLHANVHKCDIQFWFLSACKFIEYSSLHRATPPNNPHKKKPEQKYYQTWIWNCAKWTPHLSLKRMLLQQHTNDCICQIILEIVFSLVVGKELQPVKVYKIKWLPKSWHIWLAFLQPFSPFFSSSLFIAEWLFVWLKKNKKKKKGGKNRNLCFRTFQ